MISELVCVWLPYDHLMFMVNELSKVKCPFYRNITLYMTDLIPVEECNFEDVKGTIVKHLNKKATNSLGERGVRTKLELLNVA